MLSLIAFGRGDFINGMVGVPVRSGRVRSDFMSMGLMSSCKTSVLSTYYDYQNSENSCSKVDPWSWFDGSPSYSTLQLWTTFQAFVVIEFIFKACYFLFLNYRSQIEQILTNRTSLSKRMNMGLIVMTLVSGVVALGIGFSAAGVFNNASEINGGGKSLASTSGDSMLLLAASFAVSSVGIALYALAQWRESKITFEAKAVSDDFVASDVETPMNTSPISSSSFHAIPASGTSGSRLVPQQIAITINGEIHLATISPLVAPHLPARPTVSHSQTIDRMQHAPAEYIPSHNPSAPVLLMDGEAISTDALNNSYPAIPHSPYHNEVSTS